MTLLVRTTALAAAMIVTTPQPAGAQQQGDQAQPPSTVNTCAMLPAHRELTRVLSEVVSPGDKEANGGLGNPMWAVTVDRAGNICVVTRSGQAVDEQWIGSRAIAASKAYTANAFSLKGFALSTANLYWPTQPENSLYGSSNANPVDVSALYSGEASSWGTPEDPLVGQRIGGTIAFGGGLALYSEEGDIVGALGVSGDESCTDHVIAWRMRHRLNLDNIPDGVAEDGTDNIIHDLTTDPATGQKKSASGYGHPKCSPRAEVIAEEFSKTAPTGPEQ